MKHMKVTIVILISSLALSFNGCSWSKTAKGATIGAGAGGVLGGIIGKKAGNTAVGVLIGATVGGVTGAAIGRYMDKQAEEMQRDLKDAKVERIGEGIKITFDSGILYAVGSSTLTSTSISNVNKLAVILNKYEDTNILIEGHTDSTGSESLNMDLSESRSASVARQLKSQGVVGRRISTIGYGEEQPIADNGLVEGCRQNRRVEVAIFANKKLKRAARKGTI